MKKTKTLPHEYAQVLFDIRQRIQEAQIHATLSANKELIKLYWFIGQIITKKQKTSGWGAGVLDTLAQDLQNLFPGMKGFSRSNIAYMRSFYELCQIVQKPSGQFDSLPFFMIPWWHTIILMTKVKDNTQRLWYAQKAIEHGWSGSILTLQIESDLYARQGKAITNFHKTLPSPESDMAHQSLKDPYIFDFLTLKENFLERDLERGLLEHVQKFLLELGEGFAFIAQQYHLNIGNSDYYIDLLFYHLKLRCYIVIELKATAFKPEYTGMLNFYLSAVDDLLRHSNDNPTIGLLLCKTKDNFTAEYALRDINKPIGIAGYETILVESLPKNLKGSLPSIEEIEAELEKQEALIALYAKGIKNK